MYAPDHLQLFMQISYHSNFSEQLWINIFLNDNKHLLIGNIYYIPSCDKFNSTNELCELLNLIEQICPKVGFGGIKFRCHFYVNPYVIIM